MALGNAGDARKRVPSLTERMAAITEDFTRLLLSYHPFASAEEAERIIRQYVKGSVAATELAVNEDNRIKEEKAARARELAKADKIRRSSMYVPGRFGKS